MGTLFRDRRIVRGKNRFLVLAVECPDHQSGEIPTGIKGRLSGVRRRSIGDKIGIKNGDIVHSVNGQPLDAVRSTAKDWLEFEPDAVQVKVGDNLIELLGGDADLDHQIVA